MTQANDPRHLTEALLEIAGDMGRLGVMDEAAHRKIILRHLNTPPALVDLTDTDIAVLEASRPPEATKAYDDELASADEVESRKA